MTDTDREKEYGEMTAEELEQRLRETFFYPDRIDDGIFRELEALREVLEKKKPMEYTHTARESWERFAADHGEELAGLDAPKAAAAEPAGKTGRKGVFPVLLRRGLIAAVIVMLLAGVALAADSLGLWAWVPQWNAAGRYEPVRQEVSGEDPIPAALRALGITEPVYPARLPKGFVITESHISEDPLVLMEQYARGDQRLSITVTPIDGFKSTVYQRSGEPMREYRSGQAVHYVFFTDGTITSIRYTKNYATTVSGDLPLEELKGIMDSLREVTA